MAKKRKKKVPFNMNDWYSNNVTTISTANTLNGVTWMIDMSDLHQQQQVHTSGYIEVIPFKPYTKEVIKYDRKVS